MVPARLRITMAVLTQPSTQGVGMATKENWLTAVSKAAASLDGNTFRMTLHTQTKYPMLVNFTQQNLDNFIRNLFALCEEAGRYKGIAPTLSVGDQSNAVVIPATNVAAMLSSTPQSVLLVLRVGTLDMAFDIAAPLLETLGRQISELATQVGSEPRTIQ